MRTSRPGWMFALTASLLATLGCTSNANEYLTADARTSTGSLVRIPVKKPNLQTQPAARPAQGQVLAAVPQSFDAWKAQFRGRALSQGIAAGTLDSALSGLRPNGKVIELDNRQPEFSRPIWKYLDSAVSNNRVATGKSKVKQMGSVLRGIESRYGVDYPVIVAIWGLESGFGANFGSMSVVRSMATLAYDGRRKDFAEEQLIAALRIIQAGDVSAKRMVGSWAGAMGHTQFIPTSFLSYAVDYTGDGRRDIWAADAVDALASTANYLSSFGWRMGAPAVVEVTLPKNFNYAMADGRKMSASDWTDLGVRGVSFGLPPSDGVSILLPAGARGPAFAAYPNFAVIKRYNNATSYALAVAHLAERIKGRGPFQAAWPRGDRTLSRTEKQELQRRLTAMGFDTQGVDGIIGPNSRAAVRSFQQQQDLLPDGYVSAALLSAVRRAGG